MRTFVYVDGFNLYYRALRNTPYRWLDLSKLVRLLLARDNIQQIHYYTARITARPGDPDQPTRQQVYLRALATIPNLSVTFGQFTTHVRKMPLANDPNKIVEILRTDEKGSDVNLATHLVYEGAQDEYDTAVVISNDSDLAEPIRIVTQQMHKKVGVLCPARYLARELHLYATFYKPIRPSVLAASQFPQELQDAHGKFHKPATW
ncbi:MAG TPA: NYN domain protein [Elusimicrobia bacterium]|nr:NYN domain protein [Elusimicrobiota bacterium]